MSNEEGKSHSIQDASKELSIPENTVRKYLSYFSIKVEKAGRKTILTEESMKCLNEIVQLKSNGWPLKQIKEFREKQDKEGPKEAIGSEEIAQETSSLEVNIQEKPEEDKPQEAQQVVELAKESQSVEDSAADDDTLEENEIPNTSLEEKPQEQENKQDNLDENSEEPSPGSRMDGHRRSSSRSRGPRENLKESLKEAASNIRHPLTKDYVNKEIASQAKRASRLYRYLGSKHAPRDTAEAKADLDRRVIFLNGLRYLRDNWLDRTTGLHESSDNLAKV